MLLELGIILVACGAIMWAVNRWAPLDPPYKNGLNLVVFVAVVLWILSRTVGLPAGLR